MAEESVYDVKQTIAEKNCFDALPKVAEESSVETMPAALREESTVDNILSAVSEVQKDMLEIHEVSEPEPVNLRRYSTGVMAKPPSKARVQPRYLGNSLGSYHDICKHGKRDEKDVVKPWKLARKKIVGGKDAENTETMSVRRKSLGHGGKISGNTNAERENPPTAKSDVLVVEKMSAHVEPGSSSSRGVGETENSSSESAVVIGEEEAKTKSSARKGVGLRNEKGGVVSPSVSSSSKIPVKRVPRSRSAKSSKDEDRVSHLKKLKNGQRTKAETVNSEDVPEKTVYVVESSIEKKSLKGVQRGTQSGSLPSSSGKGIMRRIGRNDANGLRPTPSVSPSMEDKDLRTTRTEPRPMRQSTKSKTSGVSPGLHKRKEAGLANITTDPNTENKNRPKRIGMKITSPARQLNFRRGKVLEPQPENSAPRLLKFRRRVLPESSRGKSDNKKKNLKGKLDGDRKNSSTEGKPEKVVLRHRKVETKKKLETFNNVIEETASKLAEVRKSKVKALVGAFETVISLQDNKSSRKVQSQSTALAARAYLCKKSAVGIR